MSGAANLRIRRAATGDLAAVLQLYGHLHQKDDPLDAEKAQRVWNEIFGQTNHYVLIGELAGRAVASCVLVIVPNLTRGGRPYGLVENVVTHADFRGQGIGRAMMRHVLDLAWQKDCYKVMLLTGRKDQETLRFYEQTGFVGGVKTGFIAYPTKQ